MALSPSKPLLVIPPWPAVPPMVAAAGPAVIKRFLEFFALEIRNANTRAAYLRAISGFAGWCAERGIHDVGALEALHVAAYVESLGRRHAVTTVLQHLAALRRIFDWLVSGGVLRLNPARPVRGPRHAIRHGKTPVLSRDDMRTLLDAIAADTIVARRDRALIGVLAYAFARVGAAVGLSLANYFEEHGRYWLCLPEKGGRHHVVPVHGDLAAMLDAYLAAAGFDDNDKGPLFRSARGRGGVLSHRPLRRSDVYRMIQRRARESGLGKPICCHSFRASGITLYLQNGGDLEMAQHLAAHASPRTTKLYDRRDQRHMAAEIDRLVI